MNNSQNQYNPCRVCGETDPDMFRIWFDGYLKQFKCLNCGFISQFPGSPGKTTIIYDYEDKYNLDFLNRGQEFMYPHRKNVLQDILNRIKKLKNTGSILDVGCGDGQFLYLCKSEGLNCFGVEESKVLSSFALKKTGAVIIDGKYNKDMFPAESFDVITLIQVLEHIPTPKTILETAYYHLRKDGIIIIEVPSINSPNFLFYRATGIKWFVRPPNGVFYSHYANYSPKSLLYLTNICNFNKVSLVTGRWQYKYSGILKQIGKIVDPLLNFLNVGGILYFGKKKD